MNYTALMLIILSIFLSGCQVPLQGHESSDPPSKSEQVRPPSSASASHSDLTPPSVSSPDKHPADVSTSSSPPPDRSESSATSSVSSVDPEPDDAEFVKVSDYIPDCVVDLRYATSNNFTGQQIYSFTDAWLRYGTVKKLMLAQDELRLNGLYLKIWDAFRPASAQFKLWEVYPDPVYVANPTKGFSSHSRGNTVDITLVHADGTEAVMPTAFDDFSKLADRDYRDCPKESADNALLLEQIMAKHGFTPYFGEWWHFTDSTKYEVEKTFSPQ